MFTQAIPHVNNNNYLFQSLPNDAAFLIFNWVRGEHDSISQMPPSDDRALIMTVTVCKQWQTDPNLRREREGAATRLRQRAHLPNLYREIRLVAQYPRPLIQMFQNHYHTPILQLPVLEDRFFTIISPKDLSHPVMQIRNSNGGSAIALHLLAARGNRSALLICFHYPTNGRLGCLLRDGGRNTILASGSEFLRGLLSHQNPDFRLAESESATES